jgi:hypothetical protein
VAITGPLLINILSYFLSLLANWSNDCLVLLERSIIENDDRLSSLRKKRHLPAFRYTALTWSPRLRASEMWTPSSLNESTRSNSISFVFSC